MQHQLRPEVNGVVETSGFGLTGVSTPQTLTLQAADNYIVSRTAGELFVPVAEPATDSEPVAPTPETVATIDLPAPIAYQVDAVDRLGESILTATGVDPATLQLGSPYSDVIFGVFGDSPVNASNATLRPDEQPVADSIALGVDDWSLVWGARLPESTVDQLARIITADSYRPTDRGDQTCFVAVFETANEAGGTSLFSALQLWAQRAPVESQALATQLDPAKVQLEACDPGVGAVINVDPETGVRLVDRQIDRFLR